MDILCRLKNQVVMEFHIVQRSQKQLISGLSLLPTVAHAFVNFHRPNKVLE